MSRKTLAEREQRKQVSRRKLLKGITIALPLISTIGISGLKIIDAIQERKEKWRFLYVDESSEDNLQLENWNVVLTKYVPLGSETQIYENTEDFKSLAQTAGPSISNVLKAKNVPPGKFTMQATRSNFGIPIDLATAVSAQNYCVKASDYMYSRINGLSPLEIIWTPLKQGENYATTQHKRGFIGGP